MFLQLVFIATATQTKTQYQEGPAPPHIILGAVGDIIIHKELQARLQDGKIWSHPFIGLCQGGGRGGAIQGKEGIQFCRVA